MQVDVFTPQPFRGNPLAVVVDAEGLDDARMQQIANWTNLSETSFLLPPTSPAADYRVRIFTPSAELPFAGHPTLGSAHAWLAAGNEPAASDQIVQECGVGLVPLRRRGSRLAFAAPPLLRSGPVSDHDLAPALAALGLSSVDVLRSAWIDNGPGWMGLQLRDADAVLDVAPTADGGPALDVGVVGTHPAGGPAAIEVRAFFTVNGTLREDPVTGSLNASIAQWLLAEGVLTTPYVAAQGTAVGRSGIVHLDAEDGEVWVGGDSVTVVEGTIQI